MKYGYEAYDNGSLIAKGTLIATHIAQIVNAISYKYSNVTLINIMNEYGERSRYVVLNGKAKNIKQNFRILNSDERALVFSGDFMFSNMSGD